MLNDKAIQAAALTILTSIEEGRSAIEIARAAIEAAAPLLLQDHDEEVRVVQRPDGSWQYVPLECGACQDQALEHITDTLAPGDPALEQIPSSLGDAPTDLEAWTRGNPVDALEPHLRRLAAERGLEVDEEALVQARAHCEELVTAEGKPICTNCNGTGIALFPPPPAADRCWWCEGRGHRL